MCNLTQLAVRTGRDLRRVRERLHWTQDKLARILPIQLRTLQEWERLPENDIPERWIMEINQILRHQAETQRRPGLLALPWDERLTRVRCLVSTHPRVVLNGMPGVGKTYLAQRLLQDEAIRQQFSTRIQCSVGTKATELGVLRRVSNRLQDSLSNGTFSEISRNQLEQPLNLTDLEMSKNDLKRLLNKIDGRVLIMLDDVWRREQAVDLIDVQNMMLPKPIYLLVTTRDCTVGSAILSEHPAECSVCVDVLSEEDSLELLHRRVQTYPRPEDEQLMELARTLEHLPLSLIVAAGLMNAGKPVENLIQRLCNHDFLDSAAPLDAARSSLWHEATTIRALLDLSYEALPEKVQECYRACSAFGADTFSMTRDSFSAQWPEIEDPQSVIDLLVQRSLLEATVDERNQRRYRIHDLIRMHMEDRERLQP